MYLKSKIITWLRTQLRKSKANGFVVGLSGGVDSAVTAALSNLASKGKTMGLILPCQSHKIDIRDAKRIAGKFKIKTRLIDLSNIYVGLLKLLPKADRLTLGNLKARLRMIILYYLANKHNFLMVGTGNKSEIKMGYFTKFGDGACDLLPLGDLLKTQIKKLAKDLDIPQDIINKPPSAGLWQGQTDEAELGMSYDQLDKILVGLERGKTKDLSQTKLNKVEAKIRKTEHKRQGPKICYLKSKLKSKK